MTFPQLEKMSVTAGHKTTTATDRYRNVNLLDKAVDVYKEIGESLNSVPTIRVIDGGCSSTANQLSADARAPKSATAHLTLADSLQMFWAKAGIPSTISIPPGRRSKAAPTPSEDNAPKSHKEQGMSLDTSVLNPNPGVASEDEQTHQVLSQGRGLAHTEDYTVYQML